MIENVRVINDYLIDTTIPVTGRHNGVQITDIKGLGPITAQINTSQRGSGFGENYNSSTLGSRNIVFSIGLKRRNGGSSVEELRRQVYLYFPPGEEVQMRFKSGEQLYQIYGYVESVEPEIFTSHPSLQVSVISTDPFFRLFPNNNVILIPSNTDGGDVNYQGRINAGVDISIRVLPGAIPDLNGRISIVQTTQGKSKRGLNIEDFDITRLTQGKIAIDDQINISTVAGRKKATLKRGNTTYNIMPALKNDRGYFLSETDWPLLYVRRSANFQYTSNRWPIDQLDVQVRWEDLIEGL